MPAFITAVLPLARLRPSWTCAASGLDDALDKVETLLNEAALSGVPEIRIIHGRGTGALRSAIRDYLRGHPLTASAGPEADSGNDGVTVVELK